MFKMNKLVKQVLISMLAMPAGYAEAADLTALAAVKTEDMTLAAQQGTATPATASNAVVRSLLDKARYWKQQGRMDLAASTWERVLRSSPAQEEALAGLAAYQASMGHADLANGYLAKLQQVNPKHPVIAEVKRTLSPASASAAAAEKTDSAKNEPVATPNNPWDTLDQARLLRKQGNSGGGSKKIEQMLASAHGRDTNHAGAIFYAEENHWTQALVLLDKIPAPDRNEAISALRSRAVVYVRTDLAKQLYADGSAKDAIAMMSSAESDATGNPELLSMAAATWTHIGQADRTAALLERNKPLMTPDLQVQYAGALLQTNQDEKLEQLLNEIDRSDKGAGIEQGALDRVRSVHAVRKADTLRNDGKVAEAVNLLKPFIAKHPQDIDLLLAQARLQGAAGALPEALKSVDAVLAQEPGNHEAIRQGAVYAIQTNNYPLADQYLAASKDSDADRAGLYVEAGHAAESVQNQAKANAYFATANQLGAHVGLVDLAASPDQQLIVSAAKQSSYLEGGYAARYKTGGDGLGYLYEKEIPVAYHVPLEGNQASMVFKATDVFLAAGDPALALDLFGTNAALLAANPAAVLVSPGQVKAQGVAISAGYQSAELSADIGVSPLGFQVNNVVGGLRWNRDVAGSNIALEASRRSVAESVLSYAGVVDNMTGLAWGGVAKTGGQASVYYPFGGAWAGYGSVGLYNYDGKNVANNSSAHLNASLIYQMVRTGDYEASISARLSSTSFSNNQNWFHWGHGGYYSPQQDIGLNIPLHVAGKTEKLSYEFNIGVGIASVKEDPAVFYPTDPVRQALMGVGAAGMTVGSVNGSKGSVKFDWTVEYSLDSQFVLGNRVHWDDSPNYKQVGAMFFLRYDFDKKALPTRFPPNPIKPYYITTQGGAGLN